MIPLLHTLTALAVIATVAAFLLSLFALMLGTGLLALLLTIAAEMWQAAHP